MKTLQILKESNKKRKGFKLDCKEEEEFLNIDVSIKNLIINCFSFIDRGFDFDGEAGHDKLVTDQVAYKFRVAIK